MGAGHGAVPGSAQDYDEVFRNVRLFSGMEILAPCALQILLTGWLDSLFQIIRTSRSAVPTIPILFGGAGLNSKAICGGD